METPQSRWLRASAILLPTCFLLPAATGPSGENLPSEKRPGEKLPKGPPWHTEYRTAKREALRLGKPVYVYFTKT
ncbi:MAG: hypothetical protein ACYS5W_11195, partial [Planctomycetota bacterium]